MPPVFGQAPEDISWQAAFASGVAAHRVGDMPTARRWYLLAANGSPDPAPPRMLALLLADAGELEDAERWARRAIGLDATMAHSHAALGRVLLRADNVEAAERAFATALALDSDLSAARAGLRALGDLHLRRGRALFQARRWDDAAAALTAAARLLADSADVWHDLATALHEGGHLSGAVAAYEQALALAADRAETWHNLGSVRQGMRDIDGALAAYARAYALRPESFPRIAQELAAGNPGRVWLRAGDLRRTLVRLGPKPGRV